MMTTEEARKDIEEARKARYPESHELSHWSDRLESDRLYSSYPEGKYDETTTMVCPKADTCWSAATDGCKHCRHKHPHPFKDSCGKTGNVNEDGGCPICIPHIQSYITQEEFEV